jgi:hypothetical protein
LHLSAGRLVELNAHRLQLYTLTNPEEDWMYKSAWHYLFCRAPTVFSQNYPTLANDMLNALVKAYPGE